MKESLFGIAANAIVFAALGTGVYPRAIPHLPKEQQAQARATLSHIGVGTWAIGESQAPLLRALLKDCMTESACKETWSSYRTWYSQEFGIEKSSISSSTLLQSVQNNPTYLIQACLFEDGSSILETGYPLQDALALAWEANTTVVAVIQPGDCWAIPQFPLGVGNQ